MAVDIRTIRTAFVGSEFRHEFTKVVRSHKYCTLTAFDDVLRRIRTALVMSELCDELTEACSSS